MPPGHYAWAGAQADRWINWIEAFGVDLVGDLSELRSGEPPPGLVADPNRVRSKAVAKAAVKALTVMTREAARRPDPAREIGARIKSNTERLLQR